MKMKKVIIFGNNSFATMIAKYIQRSTDYEVCAFTVNHKFINESELIGLPVADFESIESLYNVQEHVFVVALGYKKMNLLRAQIFEQIFAKGYDIINFIHPSATVYDGCVGKGNIFLDNVFIGPNAVIGDGNIFWNGVNISHDVEIGDFNYFSPSATLAGNVDVKNNCFFGTNCTIKNGVTINSKTLIGAGCYLNNDTSENDVYVPARSIKLEINSEDVELK